MRKKSFDTLARWQVSRRSFDIDTPFRQVEEQFDGELAVNRRIPNCLRHFRIDPIDSLRDTPGRQGNNHPAERLDGVE
jgi:hypothetical protein